MVRIAPRLNSGPGGSGARCLVGGLWRRRRRRPASSASSAPADTTPPSVPAGLTAVAQSSTQILVSWTASTDASGISAYRVYRNGAATAVATVQTTNYTDTGLTAATLYSYTVSAVDAASPAE